MQPNTAKGGDIRLKNASVAEEVALYYGFKPARAPAVNRDDLHQAKILRAGERRLVDEKTIVIRPEEQIAILRLYEENNWHKEPQPIFLFFEGKFPGAAEHKNPRTFRRVRLDILGSSKSVCEAIIIKTAIEILIEEGFENLYVDINSIGDKESFHCFNKDLGAYLRKRAGELHGVCREKLKFDPLEALNCENQKCQGVFGEAPKSISYLNEPSRKHFMEVLEFLESTGIPYRVNDQLVSNHEMACHTIFEVKSLNDETEQNRALPLASGFRSNGLSKKVGWSRDIASIGIALLYKGNGKNKKNLRFKKPKIYFVQIGFEAKLKSLKIIEMLRKIKVPLLQALSRDKLSAQLATAENLKIPYTIIMGQKEAVENNVIIRDMSNRSQEVVKIEELPAYLKKLGI
ncbi:MAG: Histidine-tRNA ligase [Parcubacteria group bacterium GW2011_GWA2_47_21]|nr:MAG: Histidine-tRNA ligase [Parcubacteria group bacterium GW2011_GWA2_47_21]